MLPKGWSTYQLSELMTFRNGLNYTQTDAGEEIKVVGVADFQARSEIEDTGSLRRIKVNGRVSDADLLEGGDLLFVRSNGNKALIGRCLYFPNVEDRLSFSGFTIRGRADGVKLGSEFAAHLMRSPQVVAQMHLGGTGTNISNLSQEILNGIRVEIPPPSEQIRITAVLRAWEAAISIAERLLANSRKQKQALIKALLIDGDRTLKRLPLSVIAQRIQRVSDGEDHPVLMISSAVGFVRQDQKYNRFMAGKSLSDYTLLKQGEFAYNKGNSKLYEFGCIFPLEDYAQGLVPHVYVCFKLDGRCHVEYFKYLFEADYLHDQLGAMVNTGVRNNGLLNIRPSDFMSVKVPLPSMARQQYIAGLMATASHEVELLRRDLEALREQKDALAVDLLTGKCRVNMSGTLSIAQEAA